MPRLNDTEFTEIAPQFLGISLAFSFFSLTTSNDKFLYGTLLLLFLLIIRPRFLLLVGQLIHETVKLIGKIIVNTTLVILYLTIISAYASLYRAVSRTSVIKFKSGRSHNSSYENCTEVYTKEYFERVW